MPSVKGDFCQKDEQKALQKTTTVASMDVYLAGNIYFTRHFLDTDISMIEAETYVVYKK